MLDIKKIEAAVNLIAAEKKISKQKLLEIIESALKTAYKKDFGNKDMEVNVVINLEEGTYEISVEKEIVKEVENPACEISLKEVKEALGEDAAAFGIGDTIEIDVTDEVMKSEGFGRIASQAARQVIIQKIQENEKEKIYDLFKDKIGTIINLKIELVEKNKVLFDYNGNAVILPKSEQVSRDKYTAGQRMYLYVVQAEETIAGPKVVLSRKNKELVEKLFELNVPEIEDGTVEIVSIARIPGFKTKIVVDTRYEEVDPAGSLIGPKGIRVKTVVDELFGEKVDIVNYTDDSKEFVRRLLKPAEILDVKINEKEGVITCKLTSEEKGKALGSGGANLKLAEEISGFGIQLEVVEIEGDIN
ncbi:MAG: transcription termination factor NusA [Candidatus Gracilibacteria bacterium]|nr:transcription termination factor NusA [Candidatus Gracilibacteria bacterium]MDD4530892.1 transcription termination factor NusA [Candidatus Gracilibacteria bacterium]